MLGNLTDQRLAITFRHPVLGLNLGLVLDLVLETPFKSLTFGFGL